MATRRRTANWIQPPREEKVLEKGGHRAKEDRVGAGDIILLLITARWREPLGQRCLMGYSLSPVWTELSSSHSYNNAGKEMLAC